LLTIGIDVGGTKVLGVVVDPAEPARVLHERLVPTPHGGDGLVSLIAGLAEELRALVQVPPVALGVGVPGPVDHAGVLRMGAHLATVRDLPLATLLRERCGLPVAVDNDANGHAVAEHRGGAAAGAAHAVVVTLGTGIGAGIISHGQLVRGAHGFAGEPGHMVVDPDGPPCPCGQRGCWERYASGTGLARMGRDAALAGRLGAAVELAGGDPELVRGEHVTTAAREGDPEAQLVVDELADWIALGLSNLANLLDPQRIVIGGGLVDACDLFLPRVRTVVRSRVLGGLGREEVEIVPAVLGEHAGAIGVALLASDLLGSDAAAR
jgi:glucokinase